MKKILLFIILLTGLLISIETSAPAMDGGWSGPFGGYCRGSGWGWYGARTQVGTEREARRLVQEYFAAEDVRIGKVTERQYFFEVDITDRNNTLIDVVVVDKRTGRIRSID